MRTTDLQRRLIALCAPLVVAVGACLGDYGEEGCYLDVCDGGDPAPISDGGGGGEDAGHHAGAEDSGQQDGGTDASIDAGADAGCQKPPLEPAPSFDPAGFFVGGHPMALDEQATYATATRQLCFKTNVDGGHIECGLLPDPVAPMDGGTPQPFLSAVPPFVDVRAPSLSADGTRLYFVLAEEQRGGLVKSRIAVAQVDDRGQFGASGWSAVDVAPELQLGSPDISADDRELFFAGRTGQGAPFRLYVSMRDDAGSFSTKTELPFSDGGTLDQDNVSISDDGRWLLFEQANPNGTATVMAAQRRCGEWEPPTAVAGLPSQSDRSNVEWGPDGGVLITFHGTAGGASVRFYPRANP